MRSVAVVFFSCVWLSVCGQETSSDYFRYVAEREEFVAPLTPDITLFLTPLEGGPDIFSALSTYNFSNVRYMRRGYGDRHTGHYINGIDLFDVIGSRQDYTIIGSVRKIRPSESYRSGLSSDIGSVGSLCGIVHQSVRAREAAMGNRATISTGDRRYRWSMDISSSGVSSDERWAYSVSANRKFGRDGHIDGVFSDEGSVNVSVDRVFTNKSALTLFATATAKQQGARTASTAEAMTLTSDKYYNPSWGYQDGKIRNSKVSNRFQPLLMASYDTPMGKRSKLTMSAAYQFGKQSFSGLSWHNAQTPQPDYYRNMPDFQANQQLGDILSGMWIARDPNVTQINWNEMWQQNELSPDQSAVYMLEDRVEQIGNMQFAATATSRLNDKVEISYGAKLRHDGRQIYKQMKDLLGAEYHIDTDRFLTNEDSYGEPLQSDLRNPNRRIEEGDRFGYDYRMQLNRWSIFGRVGYHDERLRLSLAAELGGDKYRRTGNYDKEAAVDIDSYGSSEWQSFDKYSVKMGAGYSFSPQQNIDATLMYAQESPEADNLFQQPLFSNRTVDNIQSPTITAAEINYNLTLNPVKLKLSVFYTSIDNSSEIYRFYDDIFSKQVDMTLSDIDKHYYGVEVGADALIVHGLTVRLGASIGQYNYASDPRVDMVADADLTPLLTDDHAYLKHYRVGGTPQSVASIELRYSGSYGWLATASVNYTANSYVDINPVRRMSWVILAGTPPETVDLMATQERLPSAATVNLFLLKSFKLWKSDFYVIASVNNLFNNRNIIYSGYEQMRLRKQGRGLETTLAPFASKYLYAYGRTYFASINYKF